MMELDAIHQNYQKVPDTLRKMIESHPLVSQHGLPAERAYQFLEWSRKGNSFDPNTGKMLGREGLGDVISKYTHGPQSSFPQSTGSAFQGLPASSRMRTMKTMA